MEASSSSIRWSLYWAHYTTRFLRERHQRSIPLRKVYVVPKAEECGLGGRWISNGTVASCFCMAVNSWLEGVVEFVAPETWHTGSRVIEKYMYIQSYFVFSYPEPHRAAAVQELRYWCRGYATHCYTPSFVDENLERKKDKEREKEG